MLVLRHCERDPDVLGLAVARLVVKHLLSGDAPLTVAVDETFFRRWGKHVAEARWAYDGAAQGGKKTAFGNTWVIAAIVVRLPCCPGKQLNGAGDACNRTHKAVERTVPFAFVVHTLMICWYAISRDPAAVGRRYSRCPWYRTKATPAPADMHAALRAELTATRINGISPGHGEALQSLPRR